MARIALIDPSGRAATTVRAVLGRTHDVAVRSRVHAPGDVDLVIADLRYADLVDQSTLRGLTSFAPVLVLIDRREPVPPALEESGNLSILKKPFDAFELRLKVEHLLRGAIAPAGPITAPRREDEEASWLEFPYVPAPAGAVLRRAGKLSAPLWILGEPGCGRRRIALAVCRTASQPLRAVTLFPDERLEAVLAREKNSEPFALIVPDVEELPLLEQERLAAILAGQRGFRLIATSVDDPADRVVAGEFSRNLYRHLVGLAVQISPLRERPIAIPPLAQTLARRIARSLGSQGELSFSPDAMAKLQTYMWPGNLVELESVLTRTLTSISESELDGRTIEEHELLFTPEDAVRPRTNARVAGRASERPAEKSPEPARPVGRMERTGSSLVFRGPEPARRNEPEAAARQPESARAPEGDPQRPRPIVRAVESAPRSEDAGDTFERVIASLAHDLRNPMTAIQTFAQVIAAGRESTDSAKELGALATDACSRLEGALEALQEYGSFGAPVPQALDVAEIARAVVADDAEHAPQTSLGATEAFSARADEAQLRFVVENLLAAALAEAGESGRVVVRTERDALVFSVPAARGAVAKLHRLNAVERQPVSWRIVLSRAIAARNGFDVDVEGSTDGMTIRCRSFGGEGGSRDQQQQQ
jgi:DNA-binding NtrC family response regulator